MLWFFDFEAWMIADLSCPIICLWMNIKLDFVRCEWCLVALRWCVFFPWDTLILKLFIFLMVYLMCHAMVTEIMIPTTTKFYINWEMILLNYFLHLFLYFENITQLWPSSKSKYVSWELNQFLSHKSWVYSWCGITIYYHHLFITQFSILASHHNFIMSLLQFFLFFSCLLCWA